MTEGPVDPEAAHRESAAIWDRNAEAWDARMGAEGASWQKELIAPVTERLLAIRPGERALDAACGNGAFARRLAQLGATVTAFDFSPEMIARAQAYGVPSDGRIEYRVLDATDEDALLGLGVGSFEAAVCTMALMDIAVIDPLLRAVARLLRPGGRFVFSVMHPCFNTHAASRAAVFVDREGEFSTVRSIQIEQYLGLAPVRGVALREQPARHYYFHRPLGALLSACFDAGLVMDGFEEPALPPPDGPTDRLDWSNYREFSPVLVARLRVP